MRLPRLPNGFVKARTQTMQFLGVNLTENYQDGEMADSKNLSTLQYPTLSQRKGRAVLEGYSDNVTDLYEWGGHLVVVDAGTLYVDGDAITSVNSERKQFAVVNSKLIVFPDKISVDLKNNEYTKLDASVTVGSSIGTTVITHNSITAPIEQKIGDSSANYANTSGSVNWGPIFYTYGKDMTAVRECWDASTSTWDMSALASLQKTWGFYSYPCGYVSGAQQGWGNTFWGEIYIPEVYGLSSYKLVNGDVRNGTVTLPDTSEYNTDGVVGVFISGESGNYDGGGKNFSSFNNTALYYVTSSNMEFKDVFNVGDMVDVTGTLYGLLDTTYNGDDTTTSSKLKITGITETTASQANALIFADNTFHIPYVAGYLSSDRVAGKYAFKVYGESEYYSFETDKKMPKGSYIVIYSNGSTETIYIWNKEKHKMTASYTGTKSSSQPSTSTYTYLSSFNKYVPETGRITIQRSIPNLDFICERDNRLWGVSNNDKTIYCSALGIPWDFFDYNGLDTGAYAVAVGSAGDFTGIVSYGGVLCFKENKVHKMLGSFPSDFYMTTYDVAGIAQGAERSAVIISEVLYYRAPLGVMAFTGYQPTNISPNLALENTTGGVAGTNGREYFICVQAKEGQDHYTLFKYDLQYKLWIKEDDTNVTSMANLGNDLYINVQTKREIIVDEQPVTVTEGRSYLTGQQNDEGMNLEWFARFMPYIETQGGIRQAGYTRLVLRFDMAPGSRFKIKVRYDDGRWEDAWTQPKTKKLTYTVPLRIKRCDKFELMLEGKGQTKIRSIQREFVRGGWFENGSNIY